MTDKNIEKRISNAVEGLVPNVLDSVLFSAKEKKGRIYIMDNNRGKKVHRLRFTAGLVAAMMIFVLGVGSIHAYSSNNTVASIVSLDVNPSIEITVNKKERVIDVKALNGEGEQILSDMDFSGSDIDVAINAIIGSMLRNGYINELANSILISVDSKDAEEATKLRERLSQKVNDIINSTDIKGSVLSQTLTHNVDVMELAKEYGITEGKAQLISDLLTADPTYDFETLAKLSINEINLLTSAEGKKLSEVSSIGSASDKAYIGRDAAIEVALKHLNITQNDVLKTECEFDVDDGIMTYEVELHTIGQEHEFEINAITGEILEYKTEKDDDTHHTQGEEPASPPPENKEITVSKSEAENIVFAHAGVTKDEVRDLESELDEDDGIVSYEIEFKANGYEYEYDVDARSGEILKSEKEADDDYDHHEDKPAEASNISRTEAENIAFAHAGVTKDEVRDLESELDEDDGIVSYEIEFKANGYEYEYDVDARSGEILKSEKETDGDYDHHEDKPAEASNISRTEAENIAFAHAGVTKDELRDLESELDRDNGVTLYEIEFKHGNYEYSYEINAASGSILKYDKEFDD